MYNVYEHIYGGQARCNVYFIHMWYVIFKWIDREDSKIEKLTKDRESKKDRDRSSEREEDIQG